MSVRFTKFVIVEDIKGINAPIITNDICNFSQLYGTQFSSVQHMIIIKVLHHKYTVDHPTKFGGILVKTTKNIVQPFQNTVKMKRKRRNIINW